MIPPPAHAPLWWLAKLAIGIFLFLLQATVEFMPGWGASFTPQMALRGKLLIATVLQLATGLPVYAAIFSKFRLNQSKLPAGIAALLAYAFAFVAAFNLNPFFATSAESNFMNLAGLILLLLVFLKYYESKFSEEVSNAAHYLESLRVGMAHKASGDKTTTIPTRELKIGDHFMVRPGEKIPRDGIMRRGTTSVDESALTGEIRPLLKEPGETVVGGSLNRDSDIHVQVTYDPAEDILERMIGMTNGTLGESTPIHRRAALNATGLAIFTLVAAVGCFAFHFGFASRTLETALSFAISILLAAPISLVVIAETTFVGFVASALRKGIIFAGGRAVDTLARVHSIFFNKTGTLTLGNFVYSQCFIENGTNIGNFLSALFSIEHDSHHPLAKSMETHPWFIEIQKHPVRDVQTQAGLGLSGILSPRGERDIFAAAGNMRFIKRMRFHISRDMKSKMDDLEEMGETVVLSGYDRQVMGILSFSDDIRKGVRSTLSRIQHLGIETALITGDTEKTVTQLTGTLGIKKIHPRCTPEEKAAKIQKEKETGRVVALVDSDIDDNPALRAADVSLSIDTGTDIVGHPANVLILGSDFTLLHWLLRQAKNSYSKLRIAKIGTLFLGSVVTLSAFAGLILPTLAAFVGFTWAILSLHITQLRR